MTHSVRYVQFLFFTRFLQIILENDNERKYYRSKEIKKIFKK